MWAAEIDNYLRAINKYKKLTTPTETLPTRHQQKPFQLFPNTFLDQHTFVDHTINQTSFIEKRSGPESMPVKPILII